MSDAVYEIVRESVEAICENWLGMNEDTAKAASPFLATVASMVTRFVTGG